MVGVSDGRRAAQKEDSDGADIGVPWSMGMPLAFMPLFGTAWAGGLMASALVSAAAVSSAAALRLMGAGVLRDRDSAPEKHTLNAGAPAPAPARPAAHAVTTDAAHLDGAQKVQVREEELHAHKQPVQTGEVRIYKDVVTEQQTLRVPVMREEVVIERRPFSGEPAAASDIRPGEVLRIPVREERVRLEKQAVVKEEVSIGKRQVHDTKEFRGEIRKEKFRVEREGSAGLDGIHPPNSSGQREAAPLVNDQRHPERGPERQAVPPSEAENLRRWRESGAARQWVAARQGQWGQAEWLALLEALRSTPFWPMQPDAVGAALEEAKRDWLAAKEDRTGAGAAHRTTGTNPAGAHTGEG
jgi:uncharacterized protein (TIGR02271 family)